MTEPVSGVVGSDEPRVIVRADPDAVAAEAADFISSALAEAIATRGRADWVTTGGSAPVGIYPLLAREPLRSRVAWDKLHLWWSDDRFVPRDHPLSNVVPAEAMLLRTAVWSGESGQGAQGDDIEAGTTDGVWVPPEHIHPFPTTEAIARGVGADWCAAAYERVLRDAGLRVVDGWPAFDLVFLGLGPDGHVMSVFPGSETFGSQAWTAAVPAPDPRRAAHRAGDADAGRAWRRRSDPDGHDGRGKGRRHRPDLRARRRRARAARPVGPERQRHLDRRHGRCRPTARGLTGGARGQAGARSRSRRTRPARVAVGSVAAASRYRTRSVQPIAAS